jgi:hypothetical protein
VDVFLQRSLWDEEVEASKDDAGSQWTGGEETIEEEHASNPSGGDEWAEGKQADEPGIGEEWSQETPVSDSGEGSQWFEQDGSEAKSASPGSAVSSHPIFEIPSIIFHLRCMWSTRKVSKLKNECQKEFQAACGTDMISDECADFMGSSGYPSEAITECAKKRDPKAFKEFLDTCAESAAHAAGN